MKDCYQEKKYKIISHFRNDRLQNVKLANSKNWGRGVMAEYVSMGHG